MNVRQMIEYFRGQVEMLRHIMGYADDGHAEESFILDMLGVNSEILKSHPETYSVHEINAMAEAVRDRDGDYLGCLDVLEDIALSTISNPGRL